VHSLVDGFACHLTDLEPRGLVETPAHDLEEVFAFVIKEGFLQEILNN